MTIALLDTAPSAMWKSGALMADGHQMEQISELAWQGSQDDPRGFARKDDIKLETNVFVRALFTHPRWSSNGCIKGHFPWIKLPSDALFEAEIGFAAGAINTDGVTFQVYEHHRNNGVETWTRIARVTKGYTGNLEKIRADLSHLSNQEVSIELRVDAGAKSGQDWAVWVNPRIISSSDPGLMPVTVQLIRFTCGNADEDDWCSDGDEPYLLPVALCADGQTVSIDKLDQATLSVYRASKAHGNITGRQVYKNAVYAIPKETGLFQFAMKPIKGLGWEFGKKLPLTGLVVIAMEEDGTPDSAAKSAYRELAKQLKAELEKVIREMRQPTPEDIAALTGRVKDKVIATATRETLESFGLFGMADPDDYIGTDYRLWTYEEIQKAGGPGIPFTMTLKKSGCRYVVEGRVQAD